VQKTHAHWSQIRSESTRNHQPVLQHTRMLTTPEFLLSIVGGVLLLFFGEAICHILGLVVFGVFTLGQIRVQTDDDKTLTFPWHGFARDQRGRLVAQMEVAGAIGMLTVIIAFVFFLAWRGGAFRT